MRNKKLLALLITVTVFGFLARFLFQPKFPQGFHRDEASIAYNAYSILMTGKDEWGMFFPLHFRQFGDYPPGIYNYFTAISILVVGYGELAERLPAIMAGTVLIPLSYLLIKKWFHDEKIALTVAVLVAVSPWEIVQSRAGSEAILALVWAMLCWLNWTHWIEKKQWRALAWATIFAFLSMFSYNAAKLGLPLLTTWLTICWWPEIREIRSGKSRPSRPFWSSTKSVAVCWAALWWLLGGVSVFSQAGTAMSFQATTIFHLSLENTSASVAFIREGIGHVPVMLTRLLHNQLTFTAQTFLHNYLDYFSPDYLFWKGGQPGRYQIVETGLLYIVTLPFIIWGVITSYMVPRKLRNILLGFLVLAPIVAAITNTDIPNVKRSLFLFLPLYIFAALGFWHFFQAQKWRIVKVAAVAAIVIIGGWEFLWFGVHYTVHSNYATVLQRSIGWQDVFQTLADPSLKKKPTTIFEDNDTPYIFYLFYSQYPPEEYQAKQHNPGNVFRQDKQVWQLDNLTFAPGACPQTMEAGRIYVSPALRCVDEFQKFHIEVIKNIFAPDSTPKFVIYRLAEEKK